MCLSNMSLWNCFVLLVFEIVGLLNVSNGLEPTASCLKRFEYEYDVLQKMVHIEEKLNKQEKTIASLTRELKDAENELGKFRNTLPIETKAISSTYVRWGRTACPYGAELVYHGYAAGGLYSKTGSSANKLCLPSDPVWGNYTDGIQSGTGIYGGEYQVGEYPAWKHHHDNDVPCAVCRIPRGDVLMLPGRNVCYKGFHLEYSGYLMSGYPVHVSSTEFICMDGNFEVLDGGQANENGVLFYFVEAVCGSLKCPPYVEGREITCAVCSWKPYL